MVTKIVGMKTFTPRSILKGYEGTKGQNYKAAQP